MIKVNVEIDKEEIKKKFHSMVDIFRVKRHTVGSRIRNDKINEMLTMGSFAIALGGFATLTIAKYQVLGSLLGICSLSILVLLIGELVSYLQATSSIKKFNKFTDSVSYRTDHSKNINIDTISTKVHREYTTEILEMEFGTNTEVVEGISLLSKMIISRPLGILSSFGCYDESIVKPKLRIKTKDIELFSMIYFTDVETGVKITEFVDFDKGFNNANKGYTHYDSKILMGESRNKLMAMLYTKSPMLIEFQTNSSDENLETITLDVEDKKYLLEQIKNLLDLYLQV